MKNTQLMIAGLLVVLMPPAMAASFKLDANGNEPF